MKIATMQPAFLPWQGLFELIIHSDKFIFLDDFQYRPRSHHVRNKLFVSLRQVDYYSVPVQKSNHFGTNINDVLITEDNQWKIKILKRLKVNYQGAKYYTEIIPLVENWIMGDCEKLSAININFIKLVCDIFAIKKDFLYSADFSVEIQSSALRSQRIMELLQWGKATTYLCASGSFDYMLEDKVFPNSEVEVLFQDFRPVPYHQIGSPNEFVPYLSVLDALFNIGGAETYKLIRSGTPKWLSWDEKLLAAT